MLTAPLGVQATVLSQPAFFPSLGEDLGDITEEGDILFPVLGDPWSRVRCGPLAAAATATPPPPTSRPAGHHDADSTADKHPLTSRASFPMPCSVYSSTSLCVQPVLTLPRKVGVLLASELFRALLCFHNTASYPLTQAHVNIGVAQPPAPLRRVLLRRTVSVLPAKSHYTVVAAVPLAEASTYALAVAVDYDDPSGRQRQLTWNSSLKSEQPIVEIGPRSLRCVRSAPPRPRPHTNTDGDKPDGPGVASASPVATRYAVYQLSVALKNMSSVPLYMTAAELQLPTITHHGGAAVFCLMNPDSGAPTHAGEDVAAAAPPMAGAEHTRLQGAASGGAALSALLMPGDVHLLSYAVGILLEELRHATVVHGKGGVMSRLLSPRLASLGHVRWTWCRANGGTGVAQSAPLRVERLLAEAEVELGITHVTAGASAVPVAAPAPASPDPPPLLAGTPVTVHLVVHNHSELHRYDVALKVRVERLAPQWLYTGPTVRLLGHLDPASHLSFSLTLVPWQSGWLRIAADAMELVDARMPEAVLWPPSSMALLQSGSVEGSFAFGVPSGKGGGDSAMAAAGTLVATAPAVAAVAMKAAAPADAGALCNVLVL